MLKEYRELIIQELKDNCKFICIMGKKGSGKDFLADKFTSSNDLPKEECDFYKKNYFKISISYDLKLKMIEKNGKNPLLIFPHNGNYKNEIRKQLQYIGTEYYRNTKGNNYFIDKSLLQIYFLYKENKIKNFICVDCRFLNEFNIFKELNAFMIKIIANDRNLERNINENNIISESSQSDDSRRKPLRSNGFLISDSLLRNDFLIDNHVSETEINNISDNKFDYIFNNDKKADFDKNFNNLLLKTK